MYLAHTARLVSFTSEYQPRRLPSYTAPPTELESTPFRSPVNLEAVKNSRQPVVILLELRFSEASGSELPNAVVHSVEL